MKFTVDNLQLIRHAELDIDGVTVLAAPNGCGKSAISKALAMFARFNKDAAVEVQYGRVERVLKAIANVFEADGLEFIYRSRIRAVPTEHLFAILSESFWEDPQKFDYWINESFGSSVDPENRFGTLYPRDFIKAKKYLTNFADLSEAVRKELHVSDGKIARDLARSFVDGKFNEDWASRDYEKQLTKMTLGDGDAASLIELQGRRYDKGQNIGVNKYKSVFHLETYHAIDLLGETDWTNDPTGVYCLLRNNSEGVKWPNNFPINKADVLARLARISRGRLVDANVGLVYNELFSDGVERGVSPVGIASGMKPIAELYRAIEKGVVLPGGLLIIDEPETNLHPEWQVQFADFLVWFSAKCETKIVLNTHSPYFLRAVDVAARKEGCMETCHFYVLDRAVGEYRYDTRCVDGGIDEIFAEMHRPFARLREEVPEEKVVRHD